jgi:hypothetical protein
MLAVAAVVPILAHHQLQGEQEARVVVALVVTV